MTALEAITKTWYARLELQERSYKNLTNSYKNSSTNSKTSFTIITITTTTVTTLGPAKPNPSCAEHAQLAMG
uniref:Uncharacterized protein n=1 Tax=Glossina pallidipes TaxID=7398 RepID=A0A1B0AHC5_GLOPL